MVTAPSERWMRRQFRSTGSATATPKACG